MQQVPSSDAENQQSFNYDFPAIRGVQAGREFYVTMCPLRLVPKLFIFDEGEVPPSLRVQRVLNRARIPEITSYILDNPRDYVFSAITASIDGKVHFIPFGDQGKDSYIGKLVVPMTSRMIINDGQHRRAAIEEALSLRSELGDESISVVFFIDAGLRRCQQMFADLNKHAVRPSKSLGILFDYRDQLARLVMKLIDDVPAFQGRVELEKTSISNRALKLFTLNNIYDGTAALLGRKRKNRQPVSPEEERIAREYWTEVSRNIPEWQLLMDKKVSSAELRSEFIHAHGIAIHALGIAGHDLVSDDPKNWKIRLRKLRNIDWRRSNAKVWEGRAMIGGNINKSLNNLLLTVNAIKQALGLPLTGAEERAEKALMRRGRRLET